MNESEILTWKAYHTQSLKGYPHNGMWFGMTEQGYSMQFVISLEGKCISYFQAIIDSDSNFGAGFSISTSMFPETCLIGEIIDNTFYWSTKDDSSWPGENHFSYSGSFYSDTTASGTVRIITSDSHFPPNGWDSGEIKWDAVYGYYNRIDTQSEEISELESIIIREDYSFSIKVYR